MATILKKDEVECPLCHFAIQHKEIVAHINKKHYMHRNTLGVQDFLASLEPVNPSGSAPSEKTTSEKIEKPESPAPPKPRPKKPDTKPKLKVTTAGNQAELVTRYIHHDPFEDTERNNNAFARWLHLDKLHPPRSVRGY